MFRVGQNRIYIYMPYMTVYLMKSLQKISYGSISMVLANPMYDTLVVIVGSFNSHACA